MALPSTGSLSFSQIEREFGRNDTNSSPNRTLGKYRISQTVGQMDNMPLSEGIAQGDSPIKFSQFRGNRLNIVLQYNTNFGTFSDPEVAPVAQSKWHNSGNAGFGIDDEVVVVGNLKDKPINSKGKRIIIHVTSTIGGGKKNIEQTKCSLVTGRGWADDTELYINVGRTGLISGTGGFGGAPGSSEGSNGGDGEDGSSAIGINYTNRKTKIIVQNGGQVRAGGGGGGGGGGAENSVNGAPGGAGGAGAGIPDHESGPGNSTRETGLDGATGDKQIDVAGGGGGGGGAMPGGTPGEGGEAPTKPGPPSNPDNTQADDGQDGTTEGGQDGTTEGGGAGGKGDAEGGEQLELLGGAGGENGFAIARVAGTDPPEIDDPFNGVRGDISEGIFGELEQAQRL